MNGNLKPIKEFSEILNTIKTVRDKAYKQINASLIQLYWDIGKYVSQKVEKENWGKSIVQELSAYIQKNESGIKGFSARNIWRMKQFYETYKDDKKLSTLWAELSWSHHRRIMRLKTPEFKPEFMGQLEFYLEALDRDVKLPNENPSIGILLCREKDNEVVEYAISRSLSPTLIAKYETKLIPKELLRKKLNEFYMLLENRNEKE